MVNKMNQDEIEFVIPRRPVSLQARTKGLQAWKKYVAHEVTKQYQASTPISNTELQCTIVYLSGANPPDIDNIIKPIQDALIGIIYDDDIQIHDVDSHRRPLETPFDFLALPKLLKKAVCNGKECVYIRISQSKKLEEYI